MYSKSLFVRNLSFRIAVPCCVSMFMFSAKLQGQSNVAVADSSNPALDESRPSNASSDGSASAAQPSSGSNLATDSAAALAQILAQKGTISSAELQRVLAASSQDRACWILRILQSPPPSLGQTSAVPPPPRRRIRLPRPWPHRVPMRLPFQSKRCRPIRPR